MNFYCGKCKKTVETNNVTNHKTKNNRHVAKAKCPVCGSNLAKFIKAPTA